MYVPGQPHGTNKPIRPRLAPAWDKPIRPRVSIYKWHHRHTHLTFHTQWIWVAWGVVVHVTRI